MRTTICIVVFFAVIALSPGSFAAAEEAGALPGVPFISTPLLLPTTIAETPATIDVTRSGTSPSTDDDSAAPVRTTPAEIFEPAVEPVSPDTSDAPDEMRTDMSDEPDETDKPYEPENPPVEIPVYEKYGFLVPERRVSLKAPRAGRILRLHTETGKPLNAGQILVEIDCSDLEAEIEETRLLHEQAKVERHKVIEARRRGEVEAHEVDISELEAEIALARLNRLRKGLDSCRIDAPFQGVAGKIHVYEGQNVVFLAPVLEITSGGPPRFKTEVPSFWLQWLREGMVFDLRIQELERNYQGRVIELGSEVDLTTQTVILIAEIPEADAMLRAGMSARAKFDGPDTAESQNPAEAVSP